MKAVSPASVTPFPFAALESLTRADVATASRLRRVARDFARVDALAGALSELVSESATLAVRRHRRLDAPRGTDDALGVVLALPDERVTSRRVLVEVDGALGAVVVARALRQRAPRIVDASKAPSPEIAGAFAAVLLAVLRRAHAGVVAKVIAAGPGSALARDMLLAERDVTTTTVSVVIGDDAFEARVHVPAVMTPSSPVPSFTLRDLERLGDAVLALPLVAATTLAARADLAALAPGDAFVPASPRLAIDANGALIGAVALAAARSERGLSADLAADGRLVVRGLLESHPWESAKTMPSEANTTATLEVLEDAPVVVRVELGSVQMTAREWSELGPGDVIGLGRKVGDTAILRVGGVELARGELVQIEGEMAVRIVARAQGTSGEQP